MKQIIKDEILLLYREGVSQYKITEILGLCKKKVYKVLKEGLPPGEFKSGEFPKPLSDSLRNRMKEMLNQGVPCSQIAEELGVSRNSVLRQAKKTPSYSYKVGDWVEMREMEGVIVSINPFIVRVGSKSVKSNPKAWSYLPKPEEIARECAPMRKAKQLAGETPYSSTDR
jgi:transposase-like protein